MSNKLNVAIIGGGIAGLATGMKFAPIANKITIYDRATIANGGASKAAAGLLHPFAPKGKILWKGLEGYESASLLIDLITQITSNKITLVDNNAIIRPFLTLKDLEEGLKAYNESDKTSIKIITNEEYSQYLCNKPLPDQIYGGYLIVKSKQIDTIAYLFSLWKSIQSICIYSQWIVSDNIDLTNVSHNYDIVVVTAGASIKHIWQKYVNNDCPFLYSAGQNLIYTNKYIGSKAVIHGEYVVPIKRNDQNILIVGATHEKITDFDNDEYVSNISHAKDLLYNSITKIDPSLINNEPFDIMTGVRVLTKKTSLGRIPVVDKFPNKLTDKDNVWMITGLGSRGLVYHSYLADLLYTSVLNNNPDILPPEVRLPNTKWKFN